MCHKMERPNTLGKAGHFTQFVVRRKPKALLKTACHHCHRVCNHHISLDMMTECTRETPNLNRFYNACAAFAIEWYREMTSYPLGEQVCHISPRPAELDTMDKIWNFAKFTLNSVRVIAMLEDGIFANLDQQARLQEEQHEAIHDIVNGE